MATFTFDKAHLTDLKTKVVNLSNDLLDDPTIAELQEWGSSTLWDPSTWTSSTTGGGGSQAGGSAVLTLLPGNPDQLPAAQVLMTRGTSYATSVIDAVNWVHDVFTNLASNIDFTITKVSDAEDDNVLTVDQAITDFDKTIGDLGGAPKTTQIPTL